MGVDMEAAQPVSASRRVSYLATLTNDLTFRHAFPMDSGFRPEERVKSRDPKRTCRKPYRIWLHCQDSPSFVTATGSHVLPRLLFLSRSKSPTVNNLPPCHVFGPDLDTRAVWSTAAQWVGQTSRCLTRTRKACKRLSVHRRVSIASSVLLSHCTGRQLLIGPSYPLFAGSTLDWGIFTKGP